MRCRCAQREVHVDVRVVRGRCWTRPAARSSRKVRAVACVAARNAFHLDDSCVCSAHEERTAVAKSDDARTVASPSSLVTFACCWKPCCTRLSAVCDIDDADAHGVAIRTHGSLFERVCPAVPQATRKKVPQDLLTQKKTVIRFRAAALLRTASEPNHRDNALHASRLRPDEHDTGRRVAVPRRIARSRPFLAAGHSQFRRRAGRRREWHEGDTRASIFFLRRARTPSPCPPRGGHGNAGSVPMPFWRWRLVAGITRGTVSTGPYPD